ncbi:glycosyltransferase family 2 protein [Pseudoduganella namucuonensis]|uniref:Succinoglycan biosynthesis protein ExoM n=1 Tax=Pseudoduganella namucuonensis TaxID=1035707 RepID=A0A1I7K2G9_9BURK|nr:glycosyltransferase family A protein [Pseudoduganella namucuonensis]SFU91663.1 succinoglycan biosynthesis protein ExoM [Pseudoduganella namucuonensis]
MANSPHMPNMDIPRTIDVCIATFRRPDQLAGLLAALERQAPPGWRLRIVVADNDAQRSAEPVAQAWRARSAVPLVYDAEPRQNIALARNRALAHCDAECIAFIDDDELPCAGWLAALLDSQARYQADVVFGPVDSSLPPDAPPWARDCFSKPALATGTPVRMGGAGNVLFRREVLLGRSDPFDPDFGLTGGEDTDWFYRLHLAGRRMVWCAEAQASEAVPAARLRLSWARRRAFRGGQTYYRVCVRRYSGARTALWCAVKSAQLLAALAAAPLLLLLHRRAYVALTLRAAGAAGQLARWLSRRDVEEYHVRHAR